MDRNKIAIIIPYYEGEDYIHKCLSSIFETNSIERNDLSVYIIDNSKESHDKYFITFSNVKYFRAKPEIGFGRACNLGAEYAIRDGKDFLIFLNQDTHTYKGWLDALVDTLKKSNPMCVCTPMILDYNSDNIQRMIISSYLLNNLNYFTDTYYGEMKETYVLPTIGAACIAMKKDTIKKIGLFDPIYKMYAEDFDFFERLKRNGGSLLLVTKARVAHYSAENVTDKAKKSNTSLNYHLSQLIKVIRFRNDVTLINFFIKNAWYFYRRESLWQSIKYLYNGAKVVLNPKKYKETSIEELKKKIDFYIEQDKLV